jgi:hypothetical protein
MNKKVLIIFLFLFLSLSSSLSSSGVLLNKRWRAQIKAALGIESLAKQANCSTTKDKEVLLKIITDKKECPKPGTSGTSGTVTIPGTSGTVSNPGNSGTVSKPGTSGTVSNPGTSGTSGSVPNEENLCQQCYYWNSGDQFRENVTINFKTETFVYNRFEYWSDYGTPVYAEFVVSSVRYRWESSTRLIVTGTRITNVGIESWQDVFDYIDFDKSIITVSGDIALQIGVGKKFQCRQC